MMSVSGLRSLSQLLLLLLMLVVLSAGNSQDGIVVLVADWANPNGHIVNISVQELVSSTIATGTTGRPIAIDYDPADHTIYWTDVRLKQIRTTDVRNGHNNILAQLNDDATPDGIAIDTAAGVVFYTDTGNDVICTIDLQTGDKNVIISDKLLEPRAIVAYTAKRTLFWTDWGDTPLIETAGYDGRERRTLVSTGITWPNGLTLDTTHERLYWCDAKRSVIETVNLSGDDRRVVLSEATSHYFDIFYLQGLLYFTDWRRPQAIMTVPVGGGEVKFMLSAGFTRLAGLHVTSAADQARDSTGALPIIAKSTAVPIIVERFVTDGINISVSIKDVNARDDVPVGESTSSIAGFSKGIILTIILGCVSAVMLVSILLLTAFYITRRKNEKRQQVHLEKFRSQTFSNNTYEVFGVNNTNEKPCDIYLIPLSGTKLNEADSTCTVEEAVYEQISEEIA